MKVLNDREYFFHYFHDVLLAECMPNYFFSREKVATATVFHDEVEEFLILVGLVEIYDIWVI